MNTVVKSTIKMYISIGIVCPDNIRFMIPNREKPIKAKHIAKKYPEFAKLFDGSAAECCLTYYYILNKAEGVFEFKDPESEDEVAEMLGVEVLTGEYVDEDSKGSSSTKLTEEEVEEVRDYIKDIRNGHRVMEERSAAEADVAVEIAEVAWLAELRSSFETTCFDSRRDFERFCMQQIKKLWALPSHGDDSLEQNIARIVLFASESPEEINAYLKLKTTSERRKYAKKMCPRTQMF